MAYKQVAFTKKFVKQFGKLTAKQQAAFYEKLELWQRDPHHRSLRDHALKGAFDGYRSIDIEYDLRALYYVKGDTLVIFTLIGTRSQLYN